MTSTALTLDLYHIDSAYVSWRTGVNGIATFDLYSRTHPFDGGYMLVAGLEPALEFLRDFRFGDEEIAYLRTLKPYDEGFLASLRELRFTGEVLAMPEGTIAFANEPMLSVAAPFREALLLESGLLRAISVSTLIATKASRVVDAARGRPVAEFGLRRAQDPMFAARAASIAGCTSTSFLGAASAFGLAASGTIPHALVQAFPTEEEAFEAVAGTLERFTLLLDTYDVHRAIHTAIGVAHRARRRGHTLVAVRLDSGDVAGDAVHCRRALDEADLHDVRIFASGDLDEYEVARLLIAGAPIDAFGVGTSIGAGAGSIEHRAPGGSVPAVYKLVWFEGKGDPASIKRAAEKSTWPGRKQVWRVGSFERDVIALEEELPPDRGHALLQPVVVEGRRLTAPEDIGEIRERAHAARSALPERYRALEEPERYPVERTDALVRLRDRALHARGLS